MFDLKWKNGIFTVMMNENPVARFNVIWDAFDYIRKNELK